MGSRIFKIAYAVFMALVLVCVIVFMIIHIKSGVADVNSKLMLGGYVLILIWASQRLYTLVKDIRSEE